MATIGATAFSVLGPIQKCCCASGVGAISMLPLRVPSWIELAGVTRFSVGDGGAGDLMVRGYGDSVGGFMYALGIQLLKRLRSLEMAVSYSWWMEVGASLTAHNKKLSAWTMRLPSVTVGWVRYSCRNLTVSENRRALVEPSTTWKQR